MNNSATIVTSANQKSTNQIKKSKKKPSNVNTNQAPDKQQHQQHLNNITNKSGQQQQQTKNDKKRVSLENLLIDQAIRSNHKINTSNREKTATFLTEASLNDSLQRNNSNESLIKKQNKKQKSKITVNTSLPKSISSPTETGPAATAPKVIKKTNVTSPRKKEQQPINTANSSSSDIRDRYWAYLFENLKRSVDEIYRTCENDNSISECKEVILVLENCTNEFRSLAAKIKLLNEFEKAGNSNRRPNSLAWELSKSSPSTNIIKSSELISLAAGGFKDFLPSHADVSINNSNSSDAKNYDDEDYLDDYNPIDLVNHETFSDLQSINDNIEDMSFNTFSVSPSPLPPPPPPPPPPSQQPLASNLAPPPNLPHPSSAAYYSQFQSLSNQINSLLLMPSSNATMSSGHYQQQQLASFLSKNGLYGNGGFNPPPSSLNNSISYQFPFASLASSAGSTVRPASSTATFSSYLPGNESLLSNCNNFLTTNSIVQKNNTATLDMNLNDSFENGSMFDDSFKFNLNNFLANSAGNENATADLLDELKEKEEEEEDEEYHDESNEFDFGDEEDDEEEDELEYEFLKENKHVRLHHNHIHHHRRPMNKKLSHHHKNILKLYEEEEKNIALEIKQDKQLLCVLAEEVKLTRQLSVEKLMHYNHQFHTQLNNDLIDEDDPEHDDNDPSNSKLSTDCDTERTTPLNENNEHHRNANDDQDYYQQNQQQHPQRHQKHQSQRTPGRALHMHEKLLLLARKTSPNERRRKHEEKQARAQEKREKFYQERLSKLRDLTKRIQEVNELKKRLLRAKKASMKAKLERAEEKRLYLLRLKATKAAVEEQKAHEIAFINSLAAQNRKHDILEKHERRQETIKQNQEEERLRKQEEQKAKEQAAELRRKTLESERTARLKEMLEKRRARQSKIEASQLEKERERVETARAKEKTREMRLAIMEAQFQANRQQQRRRIMQRQEEWSRRHELNLEEIRKKAFEMSVLRFSSEEHQGEAPTPTPYDRSKFCNACGVVIGSEVQLKSHLRGGKHQQTMSESSQGKNLTKSEIEEYNLKCIVDISKERDEQQECYISEERRKAMKRRVKKLKNKILAKGVDYESAMMNRQQRDSSNAKSKITKLVRDIEKRLGSSERAIAGLDRQCSELSRALAQSKQSAIDQAAFRSSDGLSVCVKLLEVILSNSPAVLASPTHDHLNPAVAKTASTLIGLIMSAARSSQEACCELFMSNKLLALIDILAVYSSVMLSDVSSFGDSPTSGSASTANIISNNAVKYPCEWAVCSSLIQVIAVLFASLNSETAVNNELINAKVERNSASTAANSCCSVSGDTAVGGDLVQRGVDLVGLMTNYGLIDTLSVFFSNIRGPLDEEQQTAEILANCLNFLISITKFLTLNKKTTDIFSERKLEDTTQLISTLKSANLVNIMSMLYGMLHKDASTPVKVNQSSSSLPGIKKQAAVTIELSVLSLKLLNQMIVLDLSVVQNLLGEDSSSLQLRHIASYLIWYLTVVKHDELLHEILLLLGYFTVLNNENQTKIELGTSPTIIQQLCNLPFNYFSDLKLISILFPTLICCCFNNEKNKSVLKSEMSTDMLANFISKKINEKCASDDKFEFAKRFPSKMWPNALEYFSLAK